MVLVRIMEGIGNGNVIWFCNYNSSHRQRSQSIGIRIRNGNARGFCYRFGIYLEIYSYEVTHEVLK